MISALADNAAGIACIASPGGQGGNAVTVQLSVDFIDSVHHGQWLELAVEPAKLGRTLAFAEGRITADGWLVGRATADFRMLKG